ncbi:cell division FtsA domain-containing protein [Halonatronum saccharophilum]|uniref:cell division FtsA domain-containing protein n=1 Tax=Halonatronum saccharophilum TaxID=150060 RepID=UPI000483C800|nr:cell division FtsA domain-containing protein [Halonatronum saccharophilum]
MKSKENLIFALDIGTRTVVGALLEKVGDNLILRYSKVVEHKNRSMLDGQIHNIGEVAKQVKIIKESLEEKAGVELNKVGIAAAGRALKTLTGHHQIDFDNKKEINEDDIKLLEFTAIQDAQKKLSTGEDKDKASGYHFVGYTPVQTLLDGIRVGSLLSQSGKKIEIDIIATFLPRIVVDSLLTVIRQADLEVNHLTLEPIAAANVIVPQQMYNFNLALVDIGAGTSDIAITRDGSIIGYDMVPVAGDEMTEAICEAYMVDYNTAESIKRKLVEEEEVEMKDILDQKVKIPTDQIIKSIENKVEELARLIGDSILELNGKKPQAVICIGGGSLTPLLKEKLASKLNLPINRVGIKDGEEIKGIEGKIKNISGTQSITPFGIAVSSMKNKSRANFTNITLNGDKLHLFTLTNPKVSDALLAGEVEINALKARPGLAITAEVNGQLKIIRGTLGESGQVLVNGEEKGIDEIIKEGDRIEVKLGSKGENGTGKIKDIVSDLPSRDIIINGQKETIAPIYYRNGNLASLEEEISDGDKIEYRVIQSIREVIEDVLGISLRGLKERKLSYSLNGENKIYRMKAYDLKINNKEVTLDYEVEEGDKVTFKRLEQIEVKIKDILGEDKIGSEINISFNDRALRVPSKDFKVFKNGQKASIEDFISNGDKIELEGEGIRLNQLLDHINYQIPTTLGGKLVIEKNGEKAQLTEPLKDGDRVKLNIEYFKEY